MVSFGLPHRTFNMSNTIPSTVSILRIPNRFLKSKHPVGTIGTSEFDIARSERWLAANSFRC